MDPLLALRNTTGIPTGTRDTSPAGSSRRPTLVGLPGRPAAPLQPQFMQNKLPPETATLAEVTAGLLKARAEVAPKYFYDSLGSHLFEAITELPEYYPTRTEAAIFDLHAGEMAEAIGRGMTLIDLGAGNCAKAVRLFPEFRPSRYVAIDISVDFLREALAGVQRAHPALNVTGLGMDFANALVLPNELLRERPVFFYPGSSIGNFTPEQASRLLASAREQARGGGMLIGVDLVKPTHLLESAYDDALGVTAAFNRNLLPHLNRRIGTDFALPDWQHVARFDTGLSRIEMHLQAVRELDVRWPGHSRHFAAGERIHTESSYKYTVASFEALLRESGFRQMQHWTDPQGWFAVFWARG
jgi:L-histidine Nalpha-methyltransferase